MNTNNQTPNTIAPATAAITVTHDAADIWSAYAAAEISRDTIRAEYELAVKRHAEMCDAIGYKLDYGQITRELARAAWDECDADLEFATKKRDMALAMADDADGVVA